MLELTGWRPHGDSLANLGPKTPNNMGSICEKKIWPSSIFDCVCLDDVWVSLANVFGVKKSYQMKIIQCWWQWSAAPFSPSGLQKARNAEKVKIENRRWSYFFSKLDPMLFGVFGPKLAKESPCGHQLVNSNIAFYHPPLLYQYSLYFISILILKCTRFCSI